MKINHRILVFAAAAALLAGCATNDHNNSGAMGNDTENGVGAGASAPGETITSPSTEAPTGPNGSVGRGNPFGVGAGSGLQQAN